MTSETCPGSRPPLRRSVAAALVAAAATVAGWSTPALAQPVDGSPDPSGMPGAQLVSQIINWLMWVSLMASLGAVLYGAAMWRGGAKMGNTPRAEDGRNYVAGGAVGALLAGLAVVLINTLFEVGRAGG